MSRISCGDCGFTSAFCQFHWYLYGEIDKKFHKFNDICNLCTDILTNDPDCIVQIIKKYHRFVFRDGKWITLQNTLYMDKYKNINGKFDKSPDKDNVCEECSLMCHDCRYWYWHMIDTVAEYDQIMCTLKEIINEHLKASFLILSVYPELFTEIQNPTFEQCVHMLDVLEIHTIYDTCSTIDLKTVFEQILSLPVQYPEICKRAVQFDYSLLEFVKDRSDELLDIAFKQNACAIRFFPNPTDLQIQLAIVQNALAIEHIPAERQSVALHVIALTLHPDQYHCVQWFKNVDPRAYEQAAATHGDTLRFIKNENITDSMIANAFGTCRSTAESTLIKKKYLERGKKYSGCEFDVKTGEIISFYFDDFVKGDMLEWKQILADFIEENWIMTPEKNAKLSGEFLSLTVDEQNQWNKILGYNYNHIYNNNHEGINRKRYIDRDFEKFISSTTEERNQWVETTLHKLSPDSE